MVYFSFDIYNYDRQTASFFYFGKFILYQLNLTNLKLYQDKNFKENRRKLYKK